LPHALETFVADMRTELAMVLGKNLVAIYLYGSLTQAAFNPKRSDVDAIVVATPCYAGSSTRFEPVRLCPRRRRRAGRSNACRRTIVI